MKNLIYIIFIAVLSISTNAQHDQHNGHDMDKKAETTKKSLSPHTSAMAMIGDAHVHIDYSSPSVRDRMIFGGLVGYDRVWQSGAHKVTWLDTSKDLNFNGKTLPAGKYAFFTVPGKETWKVIFNSHWDQHGKDEYDETKNVLVLETEPVNLENLQEELTFEVNKLGANKGGISLAWEKLKIEIPFSVKE
ncbi:DUF2911 domain-containing protein [Gramella sp. AN32]|uniref:DUF2911 domain-containing protein n=1 Tax=Christiangramia antarctica TaxID=2058158 RepID=A0ABW5X6Q2_9FLAO|nr:DUF2911 domain-containing protein [Gramella sp. AN32]MCM4156632.1 hypothetical protein [Gramella sp. AN32]